MKDPTKVISVRLPLWALAGCYDLIEKTGVDVTSMGHSAIVKRAVEGLIEGLVDKGALPKYDSNQLRQKFGLRAKQPVVFPVDFTETSPASSQGGRPAIDYDRELPERQPLDSAQSNRRDAYDIAREVEKHLTGEVDPDIRQEVTIRETVDTPTRLDKINLYRVPCLSDREMRDRNPKDRFVVLLDAPDCSELVRQAIRVLYKNLPLDLWGTELAEHQINQLIQKHSEEI